MTDTDRDDDAPAGAPEPIEERVPLTLAYLLRAGARRNAPSGTPSPSGTAWEDDQDAELILRSLYEKMLSLSEANGVLRTLLKTTTDPSKFDRITWQRNAAIKEYNLCDARHSAINHGGPFKPLPKGEEERLVAAIQTVSGRIADTKRWEALLQAVDGLVQAFAAKKTIPDDAEE